MESVDGQSLVVRLLVHRGVAGTTFPLKIVQQLGEAVLVSPLGRPGHQVLCWLEVGLAQFALLGIGHGGGVGSNITGFLFFLGKVHRGGVAVYLHLCWLNGSI